MTLSINTNTAAVTAAWQLSQNNNLMQKSLTRLSSGKRIVNTADDAGGLAVSMKLNSSINQLNGLSSNIQNAQSFLSVQDGILEGSYDIVSRMSELKILTEDSSKSDADIENYNTEFASLQVQLYQISKETFNGISLFSTTTNEGNQAIFNGGNTSDNTLAVATTFLGSAGPTVSIHKSALLSALTLDGSNTVLSYQQRSSGKSLAVSISSNVSLLSSYTTSFFTAVIENLSTLRAENGASLQRLNYSLDQTTLEKSKLEAAYGRIMDVNIATETTALAKYSILVQTAASMLAQANSSPNIALMLLG